MQLEWLSQNQAESRLARRSAEKGSDAMSSPLLAEMSRTQVEQMAPRGLLVLPVGAIEQHGPHLPIGTDSITVEHLCREAVSGLADSLPIALAPTISVGLSEHHLPFGATLSTSISTLLSLLRDVGASAAASGFRSLFIVNGHGGNHDLVATSVRDISIGSKLNVAACSWWTLVESELRSDPSTSDMRIPGHAGGFETSIMLSLTPNLVREPPTEADSSNGLSSFSSLSDSVRVELDGAWAVSAGYSDIPSLGSRELGNRVLDLAIEALKTAVAGFYQDSLQEPGRGL